MCGVGGRKIAGIISIVLLKVDLCLLFIKRTDTRYQITPLHTNKTHRDWLRSLCVCARMICCCSKKINRKRSAEQNRPKTEWKENMRSVCSCVNYNRKLKHFAARASGMSTGMDLRCVIAFCKAFSRLHVGMVGGLGKMHRAGKIYLHA